MDVFASDHKVAAWIVRVAGLLLPVTLTIQYLILIGVEFFFYMTDWGLVLTVVVFSLILLRSLYRGFGTAARLMLPAVWMMNASITVSFWVLTYPLGDFEFLPCLLAHGPHLVSTSLELLWLDRVKIGWRDIVISLVIQFVYTLGVDLPLTLIYGQLYPEDDFGGILAYIGMAVMVGVTVGTGVLGICFKRHVAKSLEEKAEFY